jgi:UDPglucose 6-dehydrogenase
VCRELARAGARVRAFDPVAGRPAARALADVGASVSFPASAYEAIDGADALVIMTEWNEFRGLDLLRVKSLLSAGIIVDTRNVLDPVQTRALGFEYYCTGRQRAGALESAGA